MKANLADVIRMRNREKINLAENLSHLMRERNVSVSTTAKKVAMNKSTLHNYCNGVIPRNLLAIKKLADYFDVSLSDLLFGPTQTGTEPKPLDLQGKYLVTIKEVEKKESRHED